MSGQAPSLNGSPRRPPAFSMPTGHNTDNCTPELDKMVTDPSHEAFRSGPNHSTVISDLFNDHPIPAQNDQSAFVFSESQQSSLSVPLEDKVEDPPPIESKGDGGPQPISRDTLEYVQVEHSPEAQALINALCPAEQAIVMVDGGNTVHSQLMVYKAITRYPPDDQNKRVWTKVLAAPVAGAKKRVEYRCRGKDRDGQNCSHKSYTLQKARQHFVAGHVDEPCWSCPIEGCSDPRKYKRLDDLKHHHMVQFHNLDYTRTRGRDTSLRSTRLSTEGHRVSRSASPSRSTPHRHISTLSADAASLSTDVECERATREAWKRARPGTGKSLEYRREASSGSSAAAAPFVTQYDAELYATSLDMILSGHLFEEGPSSDPSSVRTTPSKSPNSVCTPGSGCDTSLPSLFGSPFYGASTHLPRSAPHSPIPKESYAQVDMSLASASPLCPEICISVPIDQPQDTFSQAPYPVTEATGIPPSAHVGLFAHGEAPSQWQHPPTWSRENSDASYNAPPSRVDLGIASLNSSQINVLSTSLQPWKVAPPFGTPIIHTTADPFAAFVDGARPTSLPIGDEYLTAAPTFLSSREGSIIVPQGAMRVERAQNPTSYDSTRSNQEGTFHAYSMPTSIPNRNFSTLSYTEQPSFTASATGPRPEVSQYLRTWEALSM